MTIYMNNHCKTEVVYSVHWSHYHFCAYFKYIPLHHVTNVPTVPTVRDGHNKSSQVRFITC